MHALEGYEGKVQVWPIKKTALITVMLILTQISNNYARY